MPCPRPESVGAHKLSSGSAKLQLSVRITLTMARAFTQCAYLLCRTCYISYLYVMYGYTCYGYKVLVYYLSLWLYSQYTHYRTSFKRAQEPRYYTYYYMAVLVLLYDVTFLSYA